MKTAFRIFWFITIIAIVGFLAVGCSNGTNSDTDIPDNQSITFFFRAPVWTPPALDPCVAGPFEESAWVTVNMMWDNDLGWWWAVIDVANPNAEITYQISFSQLGVTNYQIQLDGSTPIFTTTTGEIWIDGRDASSYSWPFSDRFVLNESQITEVMPGS